MEQQSDISLSQINLKTIIKKIEWTSWEETEWPIRPKIFMICPIRMSADPWVRLWTQQRTGYNIYGIC